MEWKIRIHQKALKFLEELPSDKRSLVEGRLKELLIKIPNATPKLTKTKLTPQPITKSFDQSPSKRIKL